MEVQVLFPALRSLISRNLRQVAGPVDRDLCLAVVNVQDAPFHVDLRTLDESPIGKRYLRFAVDRNHRNRFRNALPSPRNPVWRRVGNRNGRQAGHELDPNRVIPTVGVLDRHRVPIDLHLVRRNLSAEIVKASVLVLGSYLKDKTRLGMIALNDVEAD